MLLSPSQSENSVVLTHQRTLGAGLAIVLLGISCAGSDNAGPAGSNGGDATSATGTTTSVGTDTQPTSSTATSSSDGANTGFTITSAATTDATTTSTITSTGTTTAGTTFGSTGTTDAGVNGTTVTSTSTSAGLTSTGVGMTSTGAGTTSTSTNTTSAGAGGSTATSTSASVTTNSVTTGSSTTGGNTDDWYPCDGNTSGYDVVVTGSGNSWSIQGGGSFSDMASAMSAGYGMLSGSTKQAMLVQGDGTIDASAQLKMPSNIILNICGTINVTGTASGSDRSPLYARDRSNIDIPHARITGNAQYGMFFRSVSNLHLGQIELVMNIDNSGLGIRIDNNPSGGGAKVTNIQIDHVYVESTGGHGVETYGVDDIRIGRVDGVDTANCGLILNNTSNAEVGTVHCENCAHIGTGYAAFRIANSAGKIGNDWPANNIHVGEVYARNGGRGIFSVSGSGGLTIDRIDIADTGNNAILLQNCYNTTIAAESGTVSNGSVLLSNDTDNTNNGTYEPSQNVTLQNLTLSNGATLSEAWCDLGDRGNRAVNISGATPNMCF